MILQYANYAFAKNMRFTVFSSIQNTIYAIWLNT